LCAVACEVKNDEREKSGCGDGGAGATEGGDVKFLVTIHAA
jgi:hypothetical protein